MVNSSATSSRSRGFVLGMVVIAAGILVYLGVAGYLGGEQSPIPALPVIPTDQPITWRTWDSSTFTDAQSSSRLVLLLVADEYGAASRALADSIEANAELRAWLASRILPIRIDRRLRPDIADRYSEGAAPFATLLLPTGEGLTVLQNTPAEWLDIITEADRYWREHSDEMRERADEFWARQHESRPPVLSQLDAASNIAIIDSAVRAYVGVVLANHDSGYGLWRVDVTEYLRVRASSSTWAESLLVAVTRARMTNERMLWDSTVFPGASAAPVFVDQLLSGRMLNDSSAMEASRDAASRLNSRSRESFVACESAALARLNMLLNLDGNYEYEATWLGSVAGETALPHRPAIHTGLDGHLIDALGWLETLLADERHTIRAEELADSIWHNLWSSEERALRDKPAAPGPVRELENFPRAQLGRAALLLNRLGAISGDSVWFARADSCMAAFAPFVSQAGPAAAYYGAALLSLPNRTKTAVAGT